MTAIQAERALSVDHRGRAYAMAELSHAEERQRRTQLWEEDCYCSHCHQPITDNRHAEAMLRQSDQKWLLAHDDHFYRGASCAMWLVMLENQRKLEAGER